MSQILTITATITAKAGKSELVKKALLGLIPPTLKEEGCLNYDLHQDNLNPDCFFFYENWASRAHWLKHNESAHILANREATKGTIETVLIQELSPIS